MYDLETIKSMNRKVGKTARQEGLQPFLVSSESDKQLLRRIPNLGSYKPRGWRLVHRYFVDNSGLGQSDEMALTFNQFVSKVKIGRAYAVIETGQFQVRIGEYVKK